jgi:hypothetical protein
MITYSHKHETPSLFEANQSPSIVQFIHQFALPLSTFKRRTSTSSLQLDFVFGVWRIEQYVISQYAGDGFASSYTLASAGDAGLSPLLHSRWLLVGIWLSSTSSVNMLQASWLHIALAPASLRWCLNRAVRHQSIRSRFASRLRTALASAGEARSSPDRHLCCTAIEKIMHK